MLLYFDSPEGMDLANLKQVYQESLEFGKMFSSTQNFYDYWLYDFFSHPGAICAVWEENGIYVSVVCLEPYKDGVLITGLETLPAQRNMGMAGRLLSAVLSRLDGITLYSHIQRRNVPSLRLHKSCGFVFYTDHAVFLDGSVSCNYDTYILQM